MKTLPKLLTAASLLSLASCTVYETPTATAPPPPPPPVYEPAPAPPPAPVYSGPVSGPAPTPAPAPVAGPAPAYTQPQQNYNQPPPAYNQPPQQGYNQNYNNQQGYNQPPQQGYNQGGYDQPANGYNQPVTMQTFYDALSPYGQWVNYGGYGYVWIPAAGRDFTPYSTAGHWVFTDNGWMWASDYNWGWATFHYGRWDFDAIYGWMWIPDTQWGPAWVQWRSCDGYYGWAPLQPNYGWNNYNEYNPPADRWVFCQRQYITYVNVNEYYEPRDHYNDYIRRSNVISRSYYDNDSRTTYAAGPDQNEVSRASGRNITPIHIAPAAGPGASQMGGDGNIHVYRPPVVRPAANNGAQPAPQRIVPIAQVQPVAQRTTTIRPEPPRPQPIQPGSNGGAQRTQPGQPNNGGAPQPVQNNNLQQPAPRPQPTQPGNNGAPQRPEPMQQPAPRPESTQPGNGGAPQRPEPMQQPAPQRVEPVQQQPMPQRSEPMQQPAPQRTEPAQQQPMPQRSEPMQQPAPQRVEPVQQQPMPQRSEPMQQPAPQRTEPAQQQPAAQKQQPAPKPVKTNKNISPKPQPITPKKEEVKQ